jgi:shikimate dehydrogenase
VTRKRFGVVGDPIAHSRSPAMHAAAYRALGLPHAYEAVRATADELPAVVQALREGAYDGLNVTVPHKQRALQLADDADARARETGAANTLVRAPDGRIIAHNTDAPALAAELRELAGGGALRAQAALVLGSGGASRAAVAALSELGASPIVVRARSRSNWAPAAAVEAVTRAVVQATSAGMKGADPGEAAAAAVAWSAVPPDAVALDVVYAPPDTPFLRAARARGLRCANGLGMLARQGALAFELWLGVPAPLEAMMAALTDGS